MKRNGKVFRYDIFLLMNFILIVGKLEAVIVEQGTIGVYHALPYLPHNAVVVEAGAHAGDDTLIMAFNFPKGRIHAFEPVPDLFGKLKQKTMKRSNITCYNYALCDVVGTMKMFVSGGAGDASSSLFNPAGHQNFHPQITFNECIDVQTITLDQWAKQNNIDHVDLLWLDTQGAEYLALKASPNILKTVRAIITEVSFMQMYEGTPLYPEYKKWLEDQGFIVVRENKSDKDMGDALFVKKELIK